MTSAKDIFLDAVDLDPADREAFIEERCGGDADVLASVQALLAAHTETDDVFGDLSLTTTGIGAGDRIGPYELIEEIGEGGFATVWRAQQEEPIRRTVALKLLKPGVETRQIVARFEAERQALAIMEHPGIAKVLDGGLTEAGRPWFAMELVNGPSITEYCNAKRYGKKERLALMLDVCRAVQHAHQKGVVHRDLKPSNILVAEVDGYAAPKVIDFGIAKAIQPEFGVRDTLLTLEGQVVGTPAYMSPEQVDESIDIDTRADVYALGVLLYELLSGARPFEDETLAQAGLLEVLRIIREVDPPRPSARLSETTYVLPREIRGDLDWIVMRCLEKERDRRYSSAGLVADEIERHLEGEPVMAGPPDLAYRASKFAKRHRYELIVACTIAGLIVGGALVSVHQMLKARDAKAQTTRELAKFRKVSSFYESVLMGAGPEVAQGKDTELILEILQEAENRVDEEFDEEDEVEATVRRAIGGAYRSVGDSGKAEAQFRKVIDLISDEANSRGAKWRVKRELGTLLMEEERLDEAAPLIEAAAVGLVESMGAKHETTLRGLSALATLRRKQGRIEESVKLHRDLVASWTQAYGPNQESSIMALNNLAVLLKERDGEGDRSEAADLLVRALALEDVVHGERHPSRLKALNNLGELLSELERFDEAVIYLEEALEMKSEVLPDGNRSLLIGTSNLATVLQGLERYDEALAHFDRGIEMIEKDGEATTPTAIKLRFNRGICRDRAGDIEGAYEDYQDAFEFTKERFGADATFAITMDASAAWQLTKLGRSDEAETRLGAAPKTLEERKPNDLPSLAVNRIRLGVAKGALGKTDEARELLELGLDMLERSGMSESLARWIDIGSEALEALDD